MKQKKITKVEAFIKQRIKGVKNRKDIYIPPTFPKILYVLEDDNSKQDQPYFYLTRLAAECTAKRMVPDYISEKKMKELKEGNVFGCINKPVHHGGDAITKNLLKRGKLIKMIA